MEKELASIHKAFTFIGDVFSDSVFCVLKEGKRMEKELASIHKAFTSIGDVFSDSVFCVLKEGKRMGKELAAIRKAFIPPPFPVRTLPRPAAGMLNDRC